MNKKKFILIISILALSLFSNLKEINAETAKELVCVYPKVNEAFWRGEDAKRAFIQDSNGNLYLYTNSNNKIEITGDGWKKLEIKKENITYKKSNSDKGTTLNFNLNECPKAVKVKGFGTLKNSTSFEFLNYTKGSNGKSISARRLIESESIINDTIRNNFKSILGNRKTTINKSAITKNDTEISNLVCVYKVGNEELRRMIIQSKDGILYFTRKEKKDLDVNGIPINSELFNKGWTKRGNINLKNVTLYGHKSSKQDVDYVDSNNYLTKCPIGIDGDYSNLKLYGDVLNSSGKVDPNIEALYTTSNTEETKIELKDQNDKTIYDNKDDIETKACRYTVKQGKIRTIIVVLNPDGSQQAVWGHKKENAKFEKGGNGWDLLSKTTIKKLPAIVGLNKNVECPSHLNKDGDDDYKVCEGDDCDYTLMGVEEGLTTPIGYESYDFILNYKFEDEEDSLTTCEELFGNDDGEDSIINMLKLGLTIFKIAIPILLIVLGTVDFGTAILAQDEDKMKKAQNKFIRRLILGVIIFLIPSLLKIILTIANSVWGENFIDSTFCGIL